MRYCLLTLGCPKNEVDSEGIAKLLGQAGYKPVDKPAKADILVVNTCGFIDLAIMESTQALKDLAAQKRPGQILIAAGCLVERYADKLRADVPQIDAVVGTRELERIVDVVSEVRGKGEQAGADPARGLSCSEKTEPQSALTLTPTAAGEWMGPSPVLPQKDGRGLG